MPTSKSTSTSLPIRAVCAFVLVALCAGGGCASYTVAPGPRVSVTYDWGRFLLWREGRSYSAAGFSSAPVRAVAGNPLAEQHARTYVTEMRTAYTIYFVGLATSLTGDRLSGSAMEGSSRDHLGDNMHTGGLIAIGAAIAVVLLAQHHLWDAINIYNDTLEPPPRR